MARGVAEAKGVRVVCRAWGGGDGRCRTRRVVLLLRLANGIEHVNGDR